MNTTHPAHERRGRRRVALAATGIAALLALTACGGSSGSAQSSASGDASDGSKVTVKFAYLWAGDEAAAMEKEIAAFNASQDKIVVEGTSNPDQQAQVLSMQGSNPQFDISATGNSQVVQWANSGAIMSLQDFIDGESYDTSDYLPTALKNNTVDGKIYALPLASNTYQLLYNKDQLSAIGYPDGPATFEDWADVITKLTTADGGAITQMGTNPSVDYQLVVQAFGGSWYDEDGNPTPDNPTNVEALQWWVDNVITPYGADAIQTFQSGFGEYGTAQYPFYTGEISTLIDGNWQSAFISRLAPDLNWGVAPLPYPKDHPELKGTTRLDLSNLFIPANSAHPQEAWEFMKFLLDNDQMRDFTVALANLPGRTSLLDDPAYADLPNFDAFLQAAKSPLNAPSYSTNYSAQYSQDLSSALSEMAAGSMTPQQAMDQVAEQAKGYER